MDHRLFVQNVFKDYASEKRSRNRELKLARFDYLMNLLGNPHQKLPCVHVIGSSGKGSTATFLSYIAQGTGLRVGLTLSPHVYELNERVQLNNQPADYSILSQLIQEITPSIKKVSEEVSPLSYFELATALGLYYFAQQRVDLAVVEAGVGGASDVTSLLLPKATVITNVDLEHTAVLGDTVEIIASEKAGAIKDNIPVATAAIQDSVLRIIKDKAKEHGSSVFVLGEEGFEFKVNRLDISGSSFDLKTPVEGFKDLELTLLGRHQVENASLAVMSSLILRNQGSNITEDGIREGLKKAFLPGRLEIKSRDPLIIFDGAHNKSKILCSFRAVKELFPNKRITTVITPKKHRGLESVFEVVGTYSDRIILTQLRGYSIPNLLQKTKDYLSKFSKPVEIVLDPTNALTSATSYDGITLVTGSFYLLSDIDLKDTSIDNGN